jgi:hypothetical protein
MRTPRIIAGLIALGALAGASPALADTTLFKEDAEGAPDAQWVITPAKDTHIQPWQKSDSSATKFRGNQFHGGATSFWTGQQPQDWTPVDVVQGDSLITTKVAIAIPANGETTLDYWSLFQSEGDDSAEAQIAIDNNGTPGAFKAVKKEQAVNTSAGDTDDAACDVSQPNTQMVGFKEQKIKLGAYAGVKIWLRFDLKDGGENRPVSQPCGWYLDDVSITTTGTPGATAPAPGPLAPPAQAAKPSAKFSKLTGKGKKGKLTLTVAGGDIKNLTVTILKGKRPWPRARRRATRPACTRSP